jgi:hypothetical protein
MFQYLFYAVLALLGIGAVAVAVTAIVFWDSIRDLLAGWLRSKGLEKTVLMDALIRLDTVMGKVRCQLFATTTNTGTAKIEETTFTMDQIDDPQLREELIRRGLVERNVLHLVH